MGDGSSPETFTTVGEVTSIGPLAQRKDLVEATHMLSTAKEYVGGLTDGQEIQLVCNNIPSDTPQQNLWTAAGTTSTAKNFKYVFPSTAAGGSKTFSFAAVVLGSSIGATTPNGIVPITFSLKISGQISGPA